MSQRFWERDILGRDAKASPIILAELCRQMSFMLEAGVDLKEALRVLASASSKNKASKTKVATYNLQLVLDKIMDGKSLSLALEETGYFPVFMYNMCKVGEISNNLPKVMTLLADYYGETARNREELKSALLYPAIVAVMMFAMIVMAVLFILPNYALMFEVSDVPLPVLTQVLLGISDLLITRWYAVLPVAGLVIIMPTALIRTKTGRDWYEFLLLHTPVYKRAINLHIAQAMELMLHSGQPLTDAVLVVSSIIPNNRVQQDLRKAAAGLQEGAVFWMLIDNISYIDPIAVSMSRVGDEVGNMELVFSYICDYNRHRFKQMMGRLNKLAEPVITLVLGIVLALVMLSIIMPTFAMMEFVG